jgi:hypothetical protein
MAQHSFRNAGGGRERCNRQVVQNKKPLPIIQSSLITIRNQQNRETNRQ